MTNDDPFVKFKAMQRESWALFSPLAAFTTPGAASLVEFAAITKGQKVLDVATGTGVVAITAARAGAQVKGMDLSPVLLEDAKKNAAVANLQIEFVEGDVEKLPYKDGEFDVVLSQFGHMFAPRPEVAIKEMLRVLKPGGRIAFSTWPPDLAIGRVFRTVAKYLPPPPGVAPPPAWGDPNVVKERLGDAVTNIEFLTDEIFFPALSPAHYRANMELTAGPVIKAVETLSASDPAKLAQFRKEMEDVAQTFFWRNRVRQMFLMTRATKK